MEDTDDSDHLDEHNLFSDVDDSDNDVTYEPGDDVTKGHITKRKKSMIWSKPISSTGHFILALSDEDSDNNTTYIKRKKSMFLSKASTSAGKLPPALSDKVFPSESEEDIPGLPKQPPTSLIQPKNLETQILNDDIQAVDDGQSCSRKRESRKKFRREHLWKRTKSHVQRNCGKEYMDRKGKVHGARQLRGYPHECKFKCGEHIPEEKRQEIFDDYWKLANHDLQTSFIFQSIRIKEPVRVKTGERVKTPKSFSTEYLLCGRRVCKEFLRLTLDESNKRIDNVVKKKAGPEASCVPPKDLRGKKPPSNKIAQERIDLVKEHINSFPKYVSHYTRARHPTQKYLSSNLNIQRLIALYKEFCAEKHIEPVTDSFYRHIFATYFNIKFKKPHTDTCTTCDRLNTLIKHNDVDSSTLKTQLELHLRKAEAARKTKAEAVNQFENDDSVVVICFDLEKTLPTPNLTCSKVFYCRQLWTYNFCVHDLKTKRAAMFMWHEGQAGRGCQEVSSCLLKYIKTLPSTVKKIVAFSDNCGGQNKSAFIVRFWSYVVANTNIESIDHHFFVPGHSFMECDQDFAVIENAKKNSEREIFVPEDWIRIVAKASRRFIVNHMNSNDFILLYGPPLDNYLVEKVPGIQKMMWFRLEKSDPFTLCYKNSVNKDLPFSKKNLCLKNMFNKVSHFPELNLKSGLNPIKAPKYKDLQTLLNFIPPFYHDFYKNLKIAKPPKKIAAQKSSARLKGKCVKKAQIGKEASAPPEETEVIEEDIEIEPDNILYTDNEAE